MADFPQIPSSEITPEAVYLSRRRFMAGTGLLVAGTLLAGCKPGAPAGGADGGGAIGLAPQGEALPDAPLDGSDSGADPEEVAGVAQADQDELGDKLTPFKDIISYNNYYEFSESKTSVALWAKGFPTSPWEVAVGGLVNKPGTYDVGDIQKRFAREERVYRHRCVEGWSMVIPWLGFPLAELIKAADPKAEAKFVRFETIGNQPQMRGLSNDVYPWPYVEGLRLDEAMNPLAILATGLYGKDLLPQNGAPFRLVVPWKYGFKSIKAIVKIDLVATMPNSLWMIAAPDEYGFYANVNPSVPHPRWSQSSERRIGQLQRRRTLMFNGYEKQVAGLYKGMDLTANF